MGLFLTLTVTAPLPALFVAAGYFISFRRMPDDREIRAQKRWKLASRSNVVFLMSVIGGLIAIALYYREIQAVVRVLISYLFILVTFTPFMIVLGVIDRRIREISFSLVGYVKFQYVFFFGRWFSLLVVVAYLFYPVSLRGPGGEVSFAGIGVLIGGVVLFILCSLYQMRVVGRLTGMLIPAGPDDDLAAEIALLSEKAGVKGMKILFMETFGYPFLNAFAAPGKTIFITKPLVEAVSREETLAIAAHEIGHLVTMKARTFLILSLYTIFVLAVWLGVPRIGLILSGAGAYLAPIIAFVVLVLVLLLSIQAASRRYETTADRISSELMGGPEQMIAALEKIYLLNMLPRRFDKKGSENASHPSLERRVAQLKGEELPKPKRNLKRTVIVWLCLVVLMVLILLLYPWRRPDVPVGEGYQYSWVDVITPLEETVAVEPDNFEALKRLAVEYYLIEEDDLALEKTDRALALKKDPGLLVMRGLLLEFRGDRNGSLEAMEDASREGGSTLPLKWGAILAAEAGDAKKARRFMADIVKISPNDPFVREMEKRLAGGTAPLPFVGYGFAFQRGGTAQPPDAAPISPNTSKEE
jgi:Zn-dependent protease with chaperone function